MTERLISGTLQKLSTHHADATCCVEVVAVPSPVVCLCLDGKAGHVITLALYKVAFVVLQEHIRRK